MRVLCLYAFLLAALFPILPAHAEGPALPTGVTTAEIARAAPTATLETLPGGLIAVLFPPTAPTENMVEMRHGGVYEQEAVVYQPQRKRSDRMDRLVVIHYRTPDAETAFRIARLTARLLHLYRERSGRDTVFPRAAPACDVWVNAPPPTRTADAGGETWTHQIYLFQTVIERKPIEWVRTLLHEWGHLTIPAARGYTAPETDASGYLGERLFFKWLNETPPEAVDDFVRKPDLDLYYHRQVEPLITRFHEGGPSSPLLKEDSSEAMDYYIGAILAADQAFGSRLTVSALFSIESEQPVDIVRALREQVRRSARVAVRLPAWVPMDAAVYSVRGDAPGRVAIADRPPTVIGQDETMIPVRRADWKWVVRSSGETQAITIRRIGPGELK